MHARTVAVTAAFVSACAALGAKTGSPGRAASGQAANLAGSESAATPVLSEAAARAVLAQRFRRAGLRVLYDIRLQVEGVEVTLDGYDPERRVGFEYVAIEERGSDLSPQERRRLGQTNPVRVLIVDATDVATLHSMADQFLLALGLW